MYVGRVQVKHSGVSQRVQVDFSSTFQCIERVQRQCKCDTLILRRRSSYSMNRVFSRGSHWGQ